MRLCLIHGRKRDGQNYVMRKIMISFIAKYYLCDQIKTDETSGHIAQKGKK
jgi:hypothetical protein